MKSYEFPELYILEGSKPVLVHDIELWSKWMRTDKRFLFQDIVRGILVSTVFLSVAHKRSDDEKCKFFETMVFGGRYDHYRVLYEEFDSARKGHKIILDKVKREFKEK